MAGNSVRRCAALGALTLASSVFAQEVILKNDRFADDLSNSVNAQVSSQVGFDVGEIGAAILPVPASLRAPITLKFAQISWYSTPQNLPPVTQESIMIYAGSVLQPGAQLVFDSANDGAGGDGLNPQMNDGALNNFDLTSEGIVFNTRPDFITVGLKFAIAPNTTVGPSIVSDRPPGNPRFQTPGRNAIFGTWPEVGITSPQWFQPLVEIPNPLGGAPLTFGISGNLLIRAVVEGRACIADIAGQGLVQTPDGQFTADDIIIFINRFFIRDIRADVARQGQLPGPDSEFTADDIIVFINAFFSQCE
jgi:hypothetical protein